MKIGPAPELETARLHVVDGRAEQVGGQQVRGELHAGELQPERRSEGLGDQRLAQTRKILDQHVAAGEHRGEDQRHRRAPAHHHPLDLVEHRIALGGRRRRRCRHIRSNRCRSSSSTPRPGPGSAIPVRETSSGSIQTQSSSPNTIRAVAMKGPWVLALSLPGGEFELPGEHGAQVLVPVRPGGLGPGHQHFGARQPAPQRLRRIARRRVVERRSAPPEPAPNARPAGPALPDGGGHQQHRASVGHQQDARLDADDEANRQRDNRLHVRAPQFRQHPLQHLHREFAVPLVHHVRTEAGLVEQVHQSRRTVGPERVVVDRTGKHLGGRVEVLRGTTSGTLASSRSIAA